jgi:hypothetical protein
MMPLLKEKVLLTKQRTLPITSSAVPTQVAKIIRIFRREFQEGM